MLLLVFALVFIPQVAFADFRHESFMMIWVEKKYDEAIEFMRNYDKRTDDDYKVAQAHSCWAHTLAGRVQLGREICETAINSNILYYECVHKTPTNCEDYLEFQGQKVEFKTMSMLYYAYAFNLYLTKDYKQARYVLAPHHALDDHWLINTLWDAIDIKLFHPEKEEELKVIHPIIDLQPTAAGLLKSSPPAVSSLPTTSTPSLPVLPITIGLLLAIGGGIFLFRKFAPAEGAAEAQPAIEPSIRPIYDWRYPNSAYRYASYCIGAFWLLVCAPLLVLMIIPAWTVTMDFSVSGLGSAIANAKNFAFSFPNWGRPWFVTLLLIGTSFVGLKIYGRYTLPKPMRPKVRVVHTSVRLVIITALLAVAGVALVFVSNAASALMNIPGVQKIINLFL